MFVVFIKNAEFASFTVHTIVFLHTMFHAYYY